MFIEFCYVSVVVNFQNGVRTGSKQISLKTSYSLDWIRYWDTPNLLELVHALRINRGKYLNLFNFRVCNKNSFFTLCNITWNTNMPRVYSDTGVIRECNIGPTRGNIVIFRLINVVNTMLAQHRANVKLSVLCTLVPRG